MHGKSLFNQILIRQKRNDLYAIAIVNKNLVNRTVRFENDLLPLNGRITSVGLPNLLTIIILNRSRAIAGGRFSARRL